MMDFGGLSRRAFLKSAAATTLLAAAPASLAETIRERPMPGGRDALPVIGLGNSNAFRRADLPASVAVLERLREFGGRYIDCIGDSRFVVAEAVRQSGFDDAMPGTYFDLSDRNKALAEAARLKTMLDREQLDFMLCFTDQVSEHWDVLREARAEGLTRYIGTARHTSAYYDAMIDLMRTGSVDLLQVNYSILEPEAEERVLPTAMDEGVAVAINRPFINGQFFQLVRGKELPDWAAEFDCESWAQFSLKFILSHPAVTCVLTETENPEHAVDNLRAGLGRLPDEAMRERMRQHLLSLS